MKLLLTSAGITNQLIADALKGLLSKDLSDVNAAFILTAKNNRGVPSEEAMANQIAQLKQWNIPHVLVDPSFDDDWQQKLRDVDLVIIGGGNTFHLLYETRKTGFDAWLKANLESKVYMGTSAGSILMTPSIAVASVDDGDENTPNITDLTGLSFVDFEVSPHTPEDVSVASNLAYSKTIPRKLLLLDNQSAIKITDDMSDLDTGIISGGEWHWCQGGAVLDKGH